MPNTELIVRPSDQLKVRKLELKAARSQANAEIIRELIRNPVVQILAAYIIVEYLQKQKIIPDKAGSVAEGAVTVAVGLQQLAPLAPYIAQGAEGLFKAISSVTTLVGAAALKGGG